MNVSLAILRAADAASCYAPALADGVLQDELRARGLDPVRALPQARAALKAMQARMEQAPHPGPSTKMGRTWVY